MKDQRQNLELAKKAGIAPLNMKMILNQIDGLKSVNNRIISPNKKKDVLNALESGLKHCSKFTEPLVKKLYLLAKLDEVLHKTCVDPKVLTAMANLIGLPKETSDLFTTYYQSLGAKLPSRKEISIKELIGGRSNSVLTKIQNLEKKITKEVEGDGALPKEKFTVLTYYAYHKLCHHYGTAIQHRSDRSPLNQQLKKLAIEIVKGSMGDKEIKKISKYIDFLCSRESDSSFLKTATNKTGILLKKSFFKHKLNDFFKEDGNKLIESTLKKELDSENQSTGLNFI